MTQRLRLAFSIVSSGTEPKNCTEVPWLNMVTLWKYPIMLFLSLSVIMCENPVWPDWRCHPGYGTDARGEGKGHADFQNAMELCHEIMHNYTIEAEQEGFVLKEWYDICYEWCILQKASITKEHSDDFELNDQSVMENDLAKYFFNDGENESAKYISSRLVSMCSDTMKDSENLHCADKKDVWKCFENAWVHKLLKYFHLEFDDVRII